jgi:hypothetical protein
MDPDLILPDFFISHSYAWDDKEKNNGEAYLDNLCESLKKDGFKTIKDKDDLRYKDSIPEFMEERIANAKCIVILVSDKYLKSPNCMFELLTIYKKSGSHLGEMKKKIFPVIWYDAKIRNHEGRSEYGKYWDVQVENLKKLLDEDIDLSASEGSDLELYIDISNKVRKFCKFLNGINTLTPQELARDNFAVIKSAIREQNDVQPSGVRNIFLWFPFIPILVLVIFAVIFFWLNPPAKDIPELSPVVIANDESKKDSAKTKGEEIIGASRKKPTVNGARDTPLTTPVPPGSGGIIQPLDSCWVYWDTRGISGVTMSFTKGGSTYALVSDGSRMKLAIPCYLSDKNVTVSFTGKVQKKDVNIKLTDFEMPQLFIQ